MGENDHLHPVSDTERIEALEKRADAASERSLHLRSIYRGATIAFAVLWIGGAIAFVTLTGRTNHLADKANVAANAATLLSGKTSRLQGKADLAAATATKLAAKVDHDTRVQVSSGCARGNGTKVLLNQQAAREYVFLSRQARLVASLSPSPKIRSLVGLDTSLIDKEAWSPLTNCTLAERQGLRYQNPLPVLFIDHRPPKVDLTFVAAAPAPPPPAPPRHK